MIQIKSTKIAQLFPERYDGEHKDLRWEYGQDAALDNEMNNEFVDSVDSYDIIIVYDDPRNPGQKIINNHGNFPQVNDAINEANRIKEEAIQDGALQILIKDSNGETIDSVWDINELSEPMSNIDRALTDVDEGFSPSYRNSVIDRNF